MAGKEIAPFSLRINMAVQVSSLRFLQRHLVSRISFVFKYWFGKEQITITRPRHPEALPTKSLVLPLRLHLPNLLFNILFVSHNRFSHPLLL